MKKMILIAAMLFAELFTYCYGQDVNININTNGGGGYYINGISSTQDIGGVEAYFMGNDDNCCHLYLINYNSFPVTVLIKARWHPENVPEDTYWTTYWRQKEKTLTYQKVLQVGRKPIEVDADCGYDTDNSTIEGMIVRKLGQ